MELYLALNGLAILFNDQSLLSGQFSEPFCAALIPPLYCICYGVHVCESYYPLSWGVVNDVYIAHSEVPQLLRPA